VAEMSRGAVRGHNLVTRFSGDPIENPPSEVNTSC
jgi:hypothetical protein